MNLPNKITLTRICMIPVFVIVFYLGYLSQWCFLASAVVFLGAALTDALDGHIARSRGLVTNLGKFLDPIADKVLVFSALLGILYRYDGMTEGFADLRPVFIWAAAIVIFREMAVTSLRLVISGKDGLVVAASWLGKIKTTTQMVCISVIFLEPVLLGRFKPFGEYHVLSYVTMAVMIVMTLWSGIDYIVTYWKYIDPKQ